MQTPAGVFVFLAPECSLSCARYNLTEGILGDLQMASALVTIEEASARLSDLIASLQSGGRVIITDRATPVAELVIPRQRTAIEDLPESDEVDYESLVNDSAGTAHLTDGEIAALMRDSAA